MLHLCHFIDICLGRLICIFLHFSKRLGFRKLFNRTFANFRGLPLTQRTSNAWVQYTGTEPKSKETWPQGRRSRLVWARPQDTARPVLYVVTKEPDSPGGSILIFSTVQTGTLVRWRHSSSIAAFPWRACLVLRRIHLCNLPSKNSVVMRHALLGVRSSAHMAHMPSLHGNLPERNE